MNYIHLTVLCCKVICLTNDLFYIMGEEKYIYYFKTGHILPRKYCFLFSLNSHLCYLGYIILHYLFLNIRYIGHSFSIKFFFSFGN